MYYVSESPPLLEGGVHPTVIELVVDADKYTEEIFEGIVPAYNVSAVE